MAAQYEIPAATAAETGLNYPMKYLPDLGKRRPRLTNAQTRIAIDTPKRRQVSEIEPIHVRESMEFWSLAGAAANVIMQLGWPEVAYGVMESKVESGSLMKHPWKRARTTTQYLTVAILGSDEEKAAFREAVNSAHRRVRSDDASPVKYNAFNRELQLWVAACLYVGVEDTHQLLHGAMTDEELETYYQTGKVLGTTLQVPEEMWPATRADFDVYWNIASERIVVDEKTRAFGQDLVDLKMISPLTRLPFVGLLRFLTIGFLPPLLREQLDLTWTDGDRRRFENLFTFVSVVNRFLPRWIRMGSTTVMLKDLQVRMNRHRDLI